MTAQINNVGGSPLLVAAATYSSVPPTGLIFDTGAVYYDVNTAGADASDSATLSFYYPSTITGAAETKLAE